MPWDDIFKRLTGASKGVLGSLTDSLNGGREYTPEDALTVSKGPQENRGIGNILQNISLIGAQRRKASRDLAWEREDREISNDLKRAQIEDQKSEAAYRRGLLNIQERKFDIQAERSNVLNLKTEAEIQFAKANLEVKAMNAATAARQAQTQADLAQTAVDKQQWEKIRDERNFEYRQAQDFIKNDLEQRRVDIQAGYLNLAREKTPYEIAGMDARTSLANAQTEETEQRTDANIDKQMGQIMDTLGKGQKTGILTPSGTQIAAENLGVSDYLGVNPPDPSLMEKVYKMLGVDKEQTPHIDTPATPKAAPKKSKKSTKPSGQKIRVRRLSDGQTGTINAEDFDPKKYQDLSKEEGEKILSPDLAREYLKKAGGSKVLARKLAKADGFSF